MTYEPDGEQRAVIDSSAPVIVVLGGAGTGKTSTAAAAARAHLLRADQRRAAVARDAVLSGQRTALPAPDRVLFLSFSRTAVSQVIDRAGGVIGPLLQRIDVNTFDGFAWRVICHYGRAHGYPPPQVVLSAANSRVDGMRSGLTYGQLIPAAAHILRAPEVAAHYGGRYGLIICDEFQDTDDEEWEFLQLIAPRARRVFLGDLNQCIYSFKKVDPHGRVAEALALDGAVSLPLRPASHRDPSGVLPAAADAARERDFDHPAIREAVAAGRLRLVEADSASHHRVAADLVTNARERRHTVSVFTHTIKATSELSDTLTTMGIAHEQVGFGEAQGEAAGAQLEMLKYALAIPGAQARRALAVYVTATTKGSQLPELAEHLMNRSNPDLEKIMKNIGGELRAAGAVTSVDYAAIVEIISGSYARLGAARGLETWAEATPRLRRNVRSLAGGLPWDDVAAAADRTRFDTLVGGMATRRRPVQVMNLHQTKGREADTTILLLQEDEWHGRETHPFPQGSRLVYVLLTRARHSAYIVVPPIQHPLWAPLVTACQQWAGP
ncbi:UvrD-helicase domain-containing protein [Actinoplanes sp. NPDC049668]|uniref:UvrD-helicase domain-containing protein n=1 Tax=unclassified Actinoplanes TaxID=2626549 RepID=UPI00339EC7EE